MDLIFYSAAQVSKMTGMSVDWLWRQAREGRIPHHKLGGRYRWTAEDLTTLGAQSAVAPVPAQDDLVPVRGG
jgi:excisionase family DNA binding protein